MHTRMYTRESYEFDDELDDNWGGVKYNDKVHTQEHSQALLQRAKKLPKMATPKPVRASEDAVEC